MLRRSAGGHHRFGYMHQRGRVYEGIIVRTNKKNLVFNYLFDKLLHIAITVIIMAKATMTFHDIDKFNIVGMNFTIGENVGSLLLVLLLPGYHS